MYKKAPGTWGDSCNPQGGVDDNPDCDWSQGFRCFALSPTDGNAYCTQFFCDGDADCRGGWWCATVNYGPNADSAKRSSGQTYKVCQPRNYCSSCTADVDCDSTTGVPEHCILDRQGTHYCAPECKSKSNCAGDAECINLAQTEFCPGAGATCVCAARARECTGDGMLCAPCRSDADCKAGGGLCLLADNSTEHFCGVPSKVPCTVQTTDAGQTLVAECPKSDEAPGGKNPANISCLTTADGVEDPPNQCIGLVTFGLNPDTGQTLYVAGCWTANR
jgi:hypothetical protein